MIHKSGLLSAARLSRVDRRRPRRAVRQGPARRARACERRRARSPTHRTRAVLRARDQAGRGALVRDAGRRPTSPSLPTSTAAPRVSSRWRTCSRRSSARSPTSTTATNRSSSTWATERFRVDARLPVDDLNELFGTDLEHRGRLGRRAVHRRGRPDSRDRRVDGDRGTQIHRDRASRAHVSDSLPSNQQDPHRKEHTGA